MALDGIQKLLENIIESISSDEDIQQMNIKEKAKKVSDLLHLKAYETGITLKLRK
jgi:hypothetical protein